MSSKYELSYIENILSEHDHIKRETIINQLKEHLIALENNNKFVEELSDKFSTLQNEFKNLSFEKKKIELELNKKIFSLQEENKKLSTKYQNLKEKMSSIISSHSNEINKLKNINDISKHDNESLIKENKILNSKVTFGTSFDSNVVFYQKQLEESNKTIMKLNNIVKNLEEKNQNLISNYLSNQSCGNDTNIILGLRKVIDEKEKLISNLYINYDKMSIKYEQVLKENNELKDEISKLKNPAHKNSFNSRNNNDVKLDIINEIKSNSMRYCDNNSNNLINSNNNDINYTHCSHIDKHYNNINEQNYYSYNTKK